MSLAPDAVADVLKDLARGFKVMQAKAPEYRRREEYYHGDRKEVVTHPRLRTLLDRYGDAFKLNYASVPCDALIDRVDLTALATTDPGTDALLKAKLWEPNNLDDDADDYHLHASYLGDYYVIAEYIDNDDQGLDDDSAGTDDDGGADSSAGIGTVELTPKHPLDMIVIYQRSNSRIPDFAIQKVDQGGGSWEALVYYDDETWEFSTPAGKNCGDGWNVVDYQVELDDDGEVNPEPNQVTDDKGRLLFPVFHFRPDQKPYGKPVNQKMYGPQDAITKINATQLAAMDYYGFPQRYRILDANAEQDDDIDDDFNDPDNSLGEIDIPHRTVPGRSKLTSDPGGMWELPGGGTVGQFNPADPKGFLDPLTFQIRSGAILSRTPLYEFDLDGSAEMSGEARRRADGPITKHAAKVKGQFGQVWSAIGAYTLAALGQRAAKKVEAVWAPSELATDSEGITLVGQKIANGVPPRQALLEAGYTQAQVDDWMPVDETNGLAMPLTPDLMVKLAGALQQLGQAKNLTSINDDQLRRLFQPYFGDIAGQEPFPEYQVPRVTEAIPGTELPATPTGA